MTAEELHDLAILLAKYLDNHPAPGWPVEDRIKVLTQVSDADVERLVELVERYRGKEPVT